MPSWRSPWTPSWRHVFDVTTSVVQWFRAPPWSQRRVPTRLCDPAYSMETRRRPKETFAAVRMERIIITKPHWETVGIRSSKQSGVPSPSESKVSSAPGHRSQGFPTPSPSDSSLPTLESVGQLSQTSPMPSPSVSCCPGLDTVGQLSQLESSLSPSGSPPQAELGPCGNPPCATQQPGSRIWQAPPPKQQASGATQAATPLVDPPCATQHGAARIVQVPSGRQHAEGKVQVPPLGVPP